MKLQALVLAVPLLLAATPAAAACDHPFFPLKEGAQMSYSSSSTSLPNQPPHTSSMKVIKVGSGTATMETEDPTSKDKPPLTVEFACSAEGVDFDMSKPAYGSMNMKVVKHQGIAFPAASRFKAGESWETEQTMEVTVAGKTMTVDTRTSHKVIGTEKVTVPAGTFDAVKIQVDMDSTTTGGGMNMPPMHMAQTMWVARGVGMVKTAMDGGRTTELTSYSH